MKEHKTPLLLTRLLLLLLSFLLLQIGGRSVVFLFAQLREFQSLGTLPSKISAGILIFANLAFCVSLAYLSYLTLIAIFTRLNPLWRAFKAFRKEPDIRALLEIGTSTSNRNILLMAVNTALYIFFFSHTVPVLLSLSLILFALLYLVHWQPGCRSIFPTLSILSVLLFLSALKLKAQQNYELLDSRASLFISLAFSLLFAALWLLRYKARIQKKANSYRWVGTLIVCLGLAFLFYFYAILSTLNCYFDPMQKGVNYPIRVEEKCPVANNAFQIAFSYHENGKKKYSLLPVSPILHYRLAVGDTLQLHLHPGRLGWPWYHDSIDKR